VSDLPATADCRTITFLDGVRFDVVFDPAASDPLSAAYAEGRFPHGPFSGLLPALLRPGANVLDLGAHLGSFALVAAALGCQVVAVEACPRNAALLQASAARNGYDQLRVVHAAVSDRPGTLEFCSYGPFGLVALPSVHLPRVAVRAVTVDGLLAEIGWERVDVLKMDVEGSEVAAICGMSQLLARPDAPPLIYESNGHTLHLFGQTPGGLRAALEGFGYRNYQIEPGELVPVGPDDLQVDVVADCLACRAVPPLPDGWRVGGRPSRAALAEQVVAAARSPVEEQRSYLARSLRAAPAGVQGRRSVVEALAALRDDGSVAVREAAAWSAPAAFAGSWAESIRRWWRKSA